MSGSMGGATASHNRGGQYFRQRVVPTNPNTTRQQAVRAYMGAAVQAWMDTLTAGQRGAWETYAANTPKTDSLGNEIVLTGQQAYIASFVPRAQIGVTAPAAAPIVFNSGEPIAGIQDTTVGTPNEIAFVSGALDTSCILMNPAPDDGDLLFYIGAPVNPTRQYSAGPYQLALTMAVAASATTIDMTAMINTLTMDDPLVSGQYRPVRAIIAYDDGRTSSAFRAICSVLDNT